VPLPDQLSFADGAHCACGGGTAYQALSRLGISGRDRLAVFGLGPVGLGAVALAKAMGATVYAVELVPERLALGTVMGADRVIDASKEDPVAAIRQLTEGEGAEAAADFSASPVARNQALDAARIWGRVAFVGEGHATTINPSPQMLHKQLTVIGSWVCGLWQMQELTYLMVRHGVHFDPMVTHRFPLARIDEAMQLFDTGRTGKIVVEWA
jgi:threonine dehydrogenase-like Zn-dependent dehydrogenase